VRDEPFRFDRTVQARMPDVQYIDAIAQMPTTKVMRRMHKDGTLRGAQKFFFLPKKPAEELCDGTEDLQIGVQPG
jgi:hypothetical protein